MSRYPESKFGIKLNTFVQYLKDTPGYDIRIARNDERWNSDIGEKVFDATHALPIAFNQHSKLQVASISRRQFKRVRETRNKSLYGFVKMSVVAELIDGFQKSNKSAGISTQVMDIRCTFQPAKRLFKNSWLKFEYTGTHLKSMTGADFPSQTSAQVQTIEPQAQIVLALDIFTDLYKTPEAFDRKLIKLSNLSIDSSLILISLPPMNCLPGQKISTAGNLFTVSGAQPKKANQAKHVRQLCLNALEKHFVIEQVIGIGFLSALPGSLMRSRQYNDNNFRGRVCRYLCDLILDYGPAKPMDLFLTRTLGKIALFRGLSNGILIVTSPRRARISRVRVS